MAARNAGAPTPEFPRETLPAYDAKDDQKDFLTTGSETVSHAQWRAFHESRQKLLQNTITLRLPEDVETKTGGEPPRIFSIDLDESWVVAKHNPSGVRASLSTRKLISYLQRRVIPTLQSAEHLAILSLPQGEETHASVEGALRNGWTLDTSKAALEITEGVSRGLLSFTLPVQKVRGEIRNETGRYLGEFQLIARGRSNFVGSVPNRVFNINKALTEHVSNVLIPPGGTFDFNRILGGPVDVSTGWKISLGIFGNGAELAPTPGGGICQASTTTFRALVAAGLPIEERSNHSMYIKYYKQYGEGLDAAVFPGSKNLVARNDTPGYLFFRGYTIGFDAYVEVYGTPDGRRVTLEGPFRWHDAPEDIALPKGRRPWPREIVWRQRIERPNGDTEENTIRSYYMTDIPDEAPELAGEVTVILADSLS